MLDESSTLSVNIWSILLLFGALHGFFMSAIFLKKGSDQNVSNQIFAAFVAAISYILTIQFLHEARLIVYVPHLLATSTPVLYLLGPLFYLYIRSILNNEFSLRWKPALHFAPFIVCVLTIIPFYINSAEYKIYYIQQSNTGPVNLPYTRAIYYGLALLQNGIYWWMCYKRIYVKKEEVRSYLSRWLTRANVVYGIFLVVYLLVFCLFLFTDYFLREVRYGGYLLLSFSIHLYGYLLLQESLPVEKPRNVHKYMGSKLLQKEIIYLKEKLLELIENEKPYLDSELKLDDLANKLEISSHHLSQIINTGFNSNFNEFINFYRVKEAQKLLRSEQYNSYSLEGIALESGFNNRTSFYRVFRKHTGTTPAEFKKSAIDH